MIFWANDRVMHARTPYEVCLTHPPPISSRNAASPRLGAVHVKALFILRPFLHAKPTRCKFWTQNEQKLSHDFYKKRCNPHISHQQTHAFT